LRAAAWTGSSAAAHCGAAEPDVCLVMEIWRPQVGVSRKGSFMRQNVYPSQPWSPQVLIPAICAWFVVFGCLASTAMALAPAGLKTEYVENPQGLDVLRPRLSWILAATGRAQNQSAYQIQVADSAGQFKSGVIWDSGKVNTGQNFGIVYGGPDVASGAQYYWRVRVWDQDGKASAWSPTAHWEMGLLHAADWRGKWIGGPSDLTSPFL